MPSVSYIPTTDKGVLDWADNFSSVLTADPTAYALLAADATAIAGYVTAYDAAFALGGTINRRAVNPSAHTPVNTALVAGTKAALLAFVRPYAVGISLNLGISSDAKTAIGVTVRDTTKTVIPPPSTSPILNVSIAKTLQHELRFADSATPTLKAKPFGAIGMQLYCVASATVVTNPAVLPFKDFVTKGPFDVDFLDADRGKTVYYAGRWQNAKGEVGPWSPIVNFIVV